MPEPKEQYFSEQGINDWQLSDVVSELRQVREAWREEHLQGRYLDKRLLPSRANISQITETLFKVLYPMRLGTSEIKKRVRIFMSVICWLFLSIN
ncbi:hypothetical protein [Tatumella morbirosei]|uniref:hypothetical protein n=1 Tax=Tatumella morbirosei TaxID=642227 RepID=UPI000A529DCB|nr:hypothetical protein [Tatumella morbirosei]